MPSEQLRDWVAVQVKVRSPRPDRQPDHFGEAARDERRPCVVAEAAARDDAAGDRQHVLDRTADLAADRIVGEIRPEAGRAECGHQPGAEGCIASGECDRGRQAACDLDREGRAAQDGLKPAWKGLGDDLAHGGAAALLDPFGRDHHRRAARQHRRQRGTYPAQVLRRHDQEHDIAIGDRPGEIGCGLDHRVQHDTGQEYGIGMLGRDRRRDLGFMRP
jgi:hypothetical protein